MEQYRKKEKIVTIITDELTRFSYQAIHLRKEEPRHRTGLDLDGSSAKGIEFDGLSGSASFYEECDKILEVGSGSK